VCSHYACLPIPGRGCRLLAVEPCRCRVQAGIQKAHRATPEQDLAVEMQIASLMVRIPIVFDHRLRSPSSPHDDLKDCRRPRWANSTARGKIWRSRYRERPSPFFEYTTWQIAPTEIHCVQRLFYFLRRQNSPQGEGLHRSSWAGWSILLHV
jgi:hypothetical protein